MSDITLPQLPDPVAISESPVEPLYSYSQMQDYATATVLADRNNRVKQQTSGLQETDIYDFAGWLTTRTGAMRVGSSIEAGPMAEAVSEYVLANVGEYIKTFPERFTSHPVERHHRRGQGEHMKTSDLIGPALDWAVAKANDLLHHITFDFESTHPLVLDRIQAYGPSFIWSQGGPIIDAEKIELKYLGYDNPPYWGALKFSPGKYECKAAIGPTPLIAAMRRYVASKLGDEVEIPKELL